VLYWFRTDLRVTDSPALTRALALKPSTFVPVWCWDPSYIYGHRVGLNRWQFLLESMSGLSDALTELNPKQKLHVVRGRPEQLLPILCRQWGITHVVWEKDSNAYATERDRKVKEVLAKEGVEVVHEGGRHLYDPDEIIKGNKGKPTMTLHQWQKVSGAEISWGGADHLVGGKAGRGGRARAYADVIA
jgi:cryptochrome